MQALDLRRRPVALSEALDVLYRSMLEIETAIDSPAFFVAIDSLLPTIIAK